MPVERRDADGGLMRMRGEPCVSRSLQATANSELTDMNTLEIKGDWNITKGKLKQKWATLTDDDLQYVEGKQFKGLNTLVNKAPPDRSATKGGL